MPNHTCHPRCHGIILLALLAHATQLPGSARADTERPAVRVVPPGNRLQQLSPPARGLYNELRGDGSYAVLSQYIDSARDHGRLLRLVLELQTLEHPSHGDYLYQLYLAYRDHSKTKAKALAEELGTMGVAVSPSAGHFMHLERLDPDEPLPDTPLDPEVAHAPMNTWVDSFTEVTYDISYKPNRRGSLSEMLQLGYQDGSKLDIDIRLISDNIDPAPIHAIAYAYIGPAGRIMPLRMNRHTTPRLWHAKHDKALAAMSRSNQEFEDLAGTGLTGVMVNLPVGPVTPQPVEVPAARPVEAPAAQRPVAPRPAPAPKSPAPKSSPAPKPQANVPLGETTTGTASETATVATQVRTPWPPKPPVGKKPALDQAGAAEWRYQRYLHNAYKKGKGPDDVLSFDTWRQQYFEPAANGGRPGRPGSLAHQKDVERNNIPNKIRDLKVGNRHPDGVGEPGQILTIRNQKIVPVGKGRVIVESDHTIANGTMPDSAARAQLRDIRKADPKATLVLTDVENPKAAPLIYPPGTQPPPPGPLPPDQPPVVPYP